MNEVILSARDVVKAYQDGVEPALNRVSVDIYSGDFTVVMGPSGAGKSTLLYCLSGMDGISGGAVLYRGLELGKLSEAQMAVLRAEEFGFVFQQAHLVSNLTLLENVAVAGYLKADAATKAVNEKATRLLERMHADKARDRLPREASGGEAQRAAIARAVINKPGMLFADEPTGALNRKNSEEVLDLLTALNHEGQSILMVTHDVRAALRGDRILYLEDGRLRDEITLPPYDPQSARVREERLNGWLSALAW